MSAETKQNSISETLFGKVRCAVLALLFAHPDEGFYLRQIEKMISTSHGAVHRELGKLVKIGLVLRTGRGNQVYYQANRKSPVFDEIRGLMVKTTGVADVLRNALAPIADQIDAAFIYGSVARGTENAESDVDVMIIGDVSFGEVVTSISQAEEQLRREINPFVFTASELEQRIRDKEHFMTSVMQEPRIMLIGDDDDLRQLAVGKPA